MRATFRLFPSTNLFLVSSAALFTALPALAVANQSVASAHVEPSAQEPIGLVSSLPDTTPVPIEQVSAASVKSSQNNTSVSLQVNGQSIDVPTGGSSQQTLDDGQTNLSISSQQSSSSASGRKHSSTNIHISTNSTSVLNTEQTDE